jgi:hypothetical protein
MPYYIPMYLRYNEIINGTNDFFFSLFAFLSVGYCHFFYTCLRKSYNSMFDKLLKYNINIS